MSAGPSGIGELVMRSLMQKSAGAPGGPPGGMPGSAGGIGMGGENAGDAYAAQVSELKGADPGQIMAQLKKMKQIFAVMLVQNLERLPNVSGQISKLIPQIDRVIKEVQQASSVNQAVRNPIQMGSAMPPPGAEGGGNASPGMF